MPRFPVEEILKAGKTMLERGRKSQTPAKPTEREVTQKAPSAKPSGEPMKKFGSAEEAVEALRKNRGGRLP